MAVRPLDARPRERVQPEAAPQRERHLHVVPADYISGRAQRRRRRRLVVLGGVVVAAALFGVVAFHVVLTQGQLDLQHLQTRAAAVSVRQQQLRLQAAQLESPERIVDDAHRLGMVPPPSVRYLTPGGPPLTPTTVASTPKPTPKTSPRLSTGTIRPGLAAKNSNLERSSGNSVTAKATPTTARPTR